MATSQPDVLPPDRRHGRAGDRRHDLRLDVPRAAGAAARPWPGCPRQVVAGLRPGDSQRAARLQPADRRRRPRRGDPGRRPRGVEAVVEPFIAQHRDRHPPGLQPGRRPDLLDRRGRGGRRRPGRRVMQELTLRTSHAPAPEARPRLTERAGRLTDPVPRSSSTPPVVRPPGAFLVRGLRCDR